MEKPNPQWRSGQGGCWLQLDALDLMRPDLLGAPSQWNLDHRMIIGWSTDDQRTSWAGIFNTSPSSPILRKSEVLIRWRNVGNLSRLSHTKQRDQAGIKQGSSRDQAGIKGIKGLSSIFHQGQPQGPTTRFLMDKKTQKGQAQNIMIIPARWKWKLRTPSSNGSHYDLVESSPSMS
jgi:hypothetical protein